MAFRQEGHFSERLTALMALTINENNYKYLGYAMTTQLSLTTALYKTVKQGKERVAQLMKTMWRLET